MRTILFWIGASRRFFVQKQLHPVEHYHDGMFCCGNASVLHKRNNHQKCIGLEYCLSQLDNIYISAVGQSFVHYSQSTKKHATLQSVCGYLC